ncbi:pyridoxamine 5'-phosphate oxidase family protein [Pseudonocardia eucalypti]|uniref:Pyridoxamine 5'-phosphate oxidase family protein n=1 Tax=Pseudonocardia eucalypti TaxID=648755 RepID=A0ABP9QYX6_9PSEU|nr:PPOX class probable FMN-dependent enzyme [Pseudonocardia eucalypti]
MTTSEITSVERLRELLGGPPLPRVADKARDRLHPMHRRWLAASPFCLVATSGADGTCDVSPKGDPPGFARVLDDRTLALPERPGNRRADGFHNVLANPQVGLIFMVPGRGDTLRINGTARLIADAPYFDELAVAGKRPLLAMEIVIQEVFFHCAKAFLRSSLWTAPAPSDLPSRAQIAKTLERPDDSLASLEEYYGPAYATKLY